MEWGLIFFKGLEVLGLSGSVQKIKQTVFEYLE